MRHVKKRGRRVWVATGLVSFAVVALVATMTAGSAAGKSSAAAPIKIGLLSDCKGPFGNQYAADIGGAEAAFVQYAGAKANDTNDPTKGITGGEAGGHPLQIVGLGCSDATPDLAIKETRRLVEQLGAQILIGPLSGDEAVAVANYAKAHPTKVFINGTAGSQDPTMQIHPKNFFRYNGDGAQWNAGIGDLAYHKLGWRKAAIIMDDYSFGWTSAAGMIADFCGVGGQIVKRVFAPLGTTDFSSLVRQLPAPSKVDGYFWVVGGSATVPSLKAFQQAYGPLNPKNVIGNLFFSVTGNFQTIAPQVNGGYTGGFGTPGTDYQPPAAKAYIAKMASIFKTIPPLGPMNVANAYNGFFFNYYKAGWALVNALKADGGNSAVGPLGAALAKVVLNTPFGVVKLDSRHQAIEAEWSYQLQAKAGSTTYTTVQYIPNVDQSFSGVFKPTSPPPGRNQPPCVKANLSWAGKEKPVVNGVIK